MRFRLLLFILSSALVFTSCNNGFSKVEKSTDNEYKLKMADEYFAKGKYKNAQTLYESLFPVMKGTDKFEDLYYKYAYTFYNQKLYESAEAYFKGYLDVFPNYPRAEEVAYMRAYSFYKQSPKVELQQTNTLKAINMMQTFINNYPKSERVKDAEKVMEEGRAKLEEKDLNTAQLYYNLGHYRAAALAFGELLNKYPETQKADEYQYQAIKAYYKFAEMSFIDKQAERYQKVVDESEEFKARFPESKYVKETEGLSNNSQKRIKEIANEQIASSAQR